RTIVYIDTNRQEQADAAYQQLLASFPGHKDIAQAVHDIAYQYRCANKQQKANQIDQYVIDHWPDSDYAVLGQMDIAKYYVDQGNDPNAEAATTKLLTSYPGNVLIARAIHDVAQQYRGTRKYEKANRLYQYVINNWPDAEHALWSQADLIKSHLAEGNDVAAEAAVKKLLTNFNDNPLIARAVWDTGQFYRESKKYEKANELYQHVVKTWPKAEHALWAQADLIKSYLALGDDTAANTAVDRLLTNFNDNPLIARAVWDTGQYYRELKKYEMANKLYQHVVKTSPESEHALWAQADLIKSYLALGDDPNAEVAVKKLLPECAHNKHIARAIHDTAWEYRKSGNYGRANELDQYVIDHWPADVQVMWAKMDMAKTDIGLGNDAVVEKTIDILIADFNECPELPTAIFMLGEEYYNKDFNTKGDPNSPDAKPEEYYRKALAVWERIIQKLPPSPTTPQAYWCSAVVYSQELGEYQKGIEYYQQIVDNWPNYQYAWHAQFFIGMYYEKLRDSGGIPESEVNPKIEQAYKAVVEKYPDSNSSPHAALKLGQLNFNRGQWADAAKYFEIFLEKAPEDQRRVDVLYDLGRAYEKMGELSLAAEMYRIFIEMAAPNDQRIKTVKAVLEKLEGATK
ncbi:MAG: tetratricopeptide repeat protein, partial [Planctomycetota bacterium]|nr:tetratricopeptide repeat protein [Planctomycetota bacterium]